MYKWKQFTDESPQSRRRVIVKRRYGGKVIITEGWYSKALDCWFNDWGQTINRSNVIAWAKKPSRS
jgi:hypothetical protein